MLSSNFWLQPKLMEIQNLRVQGVKCTRKTHLFHLRGDATSSPYLLFVPCMHDRMQMHSAYLTGIQSVLRNDGNLFHHSPKSRLRGVRDERHRLHGDFCHSELLSFKRNAHTYKEKSLFSHITANPLVQSLKV